jgi:hypothetical protein
MDKKQFTIRTSLGMTAGVATGVLADPMRLAVVVIGLSKKYRALHAATLKRSVPAIADVVVAAAPKPAH